MRPTPSLMTDVIAADDPSHHQTGTPPHHQHLLSGTPTSAPRKPQRRANRASRPAAAPIDNIPRRELYPIPEARQLLGGLSHAGFYSRVRDGQITLVHLGRRSYVSAATIARIVSGL